MQRKRFDPLDEADLLAALQDNFTPHAIAAMASLLSTAVATIGTNAPEIDSELTWFSNELMTLLGGQPAWAKLGQEIGL